MLNILLVNQKLGIPMYILMHTSNYYFNENWDVWHKTKSVHISNWYKPMR